MTGEASAGFRRVSIMCKWARGPGECEITGHTCGERKSAPTEYRGKKYIGTGQGRGACNRTEGTAREGGGK